MRNEYWQLLGIPQGGWPLILEMKKGFGYGVYLQLAKETGLGKKRVAQIVGITKGTLNRRAAAGKFTTEESDRIYRFARMIDASIRLYEGNKEAAMEWINQPVRGLGNQAPVDMTQTSFESDAVLELIGRLEQGIPP